MAAGAIVGRDPRAVIPKRFRAPEPPPRQMTAEERAVALEIGLMNMELALRRD